MIGRLRTGWGKGCNGPVAAHGNAGHDHFEDVLGKVAIGSGASRSVPDVHLTRFAAYFVALNAGQSKPESTAHDTPKTDHATHHLA